MFIDAHCHLEMLENVEKAIERAGEKRVGIIIANGINPESNRKVLEFSKKYENVRASLGLYPTDALKMSDGEIEDELLFIMRNKEKIIAIGEVGIDFKESTNEQERERQIKIFKKIIELAKDVDKPLIVHSRKAEKECIDILEEMKAKKVVMHCFSGKFNLTERIVKNSWYLTIPTNVKNSEQFQNIALKIPIENLLCETDSPFLHPDKKGENNPSNVVESYKKIAELRKMKLKEVENKIEQNFKKLFY